MSAQITVANAQQTTKFASPEVVEGGGNLAAALPWSRREPSSGSPQRLRNRLTRSTVGIVAQRGRRN